MEREQIAAFNRDLKEAISDVRKHEYRREVQIATNSDALRAIDNRVRTDSQLIMQDRLQLLSEIEGSDMFAGNAPLG